VLAALSKLFESVYLVVGGFDPQAAFVEEKCGHGADIHVHHKEDPLPAAVLLCFYPANKDTYALIPFILVVIIEQETFFSMFLA